MNVKKFLKPNWKKIVLSIIIPIQATLIGGLIANFPSYSEVGYNIGSNYFLIFMLPVLLSRVFSIPWEPIISWQVLIIIFSLLLYWYILSCLIVWIYDKVKKK